MKKILILLLSIVTFHVFATASISMQYQDDDYTITNEMLKNAYTINRQGSDKSDIIYFLPTAIFKDNESQQVIFIDLYTDLHRYNIFQFYIKEIPNEIIQQYSNFVKLNNINIDVTKKIKDSIKNATVVQKKIFHNKREFSIRYES